MTNIGIIGYGHWGPNLLRNFYALDNACVKYLADHNDDNRARAAADYPDVTTVADAQTLFDDPELQAVAIATPVSTHFELAKTALLAGKHVLVEKPMTATVAEAEALVRIANEKGLVIMVDHISLYMGTVRKLKALVESGELGEIQYIDSTRINLGLFQQDVNVIWDLASHDLSVMDYLMAAKPVSVQAVGAAHSPSGLENIAFLTVKFDNGAIAHFNVSWVSPIKQRRTLIGGDRKMALWDDMEPVDKIKVFDTGYSATQDTAQSRIEYTYRTGEVQTPSIDNPEALKLVVRDFLSAITTGTTPVANYDSGLTVMRVLEASQESIKNDGKVVLL